MGFRCPCCHKDFGNDKLAWQKHIETCGLAQNMVNIYTAETEEEAARSIKVLAKKIKKKMEGEN